MAAVAAGRALRLSGANGLGDSDDYHIAKMLISFLKGFQLSIFLCNQFW
jgi:hypothetical protein